MEECKTMYDLHCKDEFKDLKDSINEIKTQRKEDIVEINSSIKDLTKAIIGNGSPGLKTDVDRLKQKEEGRQWWTRGFMGAIIALVAKAIWDIVANR